MHVFELTNFVLLMKKKSCFLSKILVNNNYQTYINDLFSLRYYVRINILFSIKKKDVCTK